MEKESPPILSIYIKHNEGKVGFTGNRQAMIEWLLCQRQHYLYSWRLRNVVISLSCDSHYQLFTSIETTYLVIDHQVH